MGMFDDILVEPQAKKSAGMFDDILMKPRTPITSPETQPVLPGDIDTPASAVPSPATAKATAIAAPARPASRPLFETDVQSAVPQPRGALELVGTALKRGAVSTVPGAVGKAMEFFSEPGPGQPVYEEGREIAAAAEERAKRPDLAMPTEEEAAKHPVGSFFAEGAEQLPLSMAGIVPGVGDALFYGSQAQESYENVKKQLLEQGVPDAEAEEQAITAGHKSGAIEAGGERLASLFGAKLLGIFGKALGRGARTAGDVLKNIAKPAMVKEFAKDLGKTIAAETVTEVGQNVGERYVEQEAGATAGPSLFEAGRQVISPTVAMTLLMAPFGIPARIKQSGKHRELVTALEDPGVPVERRAAAAQAVGEAIERADKTAAKNWRNNSAWAIDRDQPIGLDESFLTPGTDFVPPQAATATAAVAEEPASAVPQKRPAPAIPEEGFTGVGDRLASQRATAVPGVGGGFGYAKRVRDERAFIDLVGQNLPAPEAPAETPVFDLDLTTLVPTSRGMKALKDTLEARRRDAAQGAAAVPLPSVVAQRDKADRVMTDVLRQLGGPEETPGAEPTSAVPAGLLPKPGAPGSGGAAAVPAENLPEAQAEQIKIALPDLDQKAHEAATSPLSAIPQPTEAQRDAGNYRKGHLNVQGLDISIENPKGTVRTGKSPEGRPWTTTLRSHYGYIKGTVGKDKDHIDTFIGPNPESQKVFVVDQTNPKTGAFDEHKVMLGHDSLAAAEHGYLENYEPGWQGMGAITEMTMPEFKAWLASGKTKKALNYKENVPRGTPEHRLDARLRAEFKRMMDEGRDDEAFDLAYRDKLTGLYNQNGWERLKEAGDVNNMPVALADLAGFKYLNDKYGHGFGDSVLKEYARSLESHGVKVFRSGGDETATVPVDGKNETLADAMTRAKADLAAKEFRAKDLKTGIMNTITGVSLDYGIDIGPTAADNAFHAERDRLERDKQRNPKRGGRPVGLTETPDVEAAGEARPEPAAEEVTEVTSAVPQRQPQAEPATPTTAQPAPAEPLTGIPKLEAELTRPAVPAEQPLAEMTLDDITDDLAAGNARVLKFARQAVDRLGRDAATDELFNKAFGKAIKNKTRPQFLSIEQALRAILRGESVEDAQKLVKPVPQKAEEAVPETAVPTAETTTLETAVPEPKTETTIPMVPEEQLTGDYFTKKMQAVNYLQDGRDVIHAHEAAINTVERQAGFEPTVGEGGSGFGARGFSTVTPKEWQARLKKIESKNADAAQKLRALIKDGQALDKIWDAKYANMPESAEAERQAEEQEKEYQAREAEVAAKNKEIQARPALAEQSITDGKIKTITGREIPAPPVIRTDTPQKAKRDMQRVEYWLMGQAVEEAKARDDDFNATTFKGLKPGKFSQADKDAVNVYLFNTENPQFIKEKAETKPRTKKETPAEIAERERRAAEGRAMQERHEAVDAENKAATATPEQLDLVKSIYRDILENPGVDEDTPDIDYKLWTEQMQEAAEDPGELVALDNPKGITIGDWVRRDDPKFGTTYGRAISISRNFNGAIQVSIAMNDSYGASYGLETITRIPPPAGGWRDVPGLEHAAPAKEIEAKQKKESIERDQIKSVRMWIAEELKSREVLTRDARTIQKILELYKFPQMRRSKLEEQLVAVKNELKRDEQRLQELEEKGDSALSEYDINMGNTAESSKKLVGNHVEADKIKIEAIRYQLSKVGGAEPGKGKKKGDIESQPGEDETPAGLDAKNKSLTLKPETAEPWIQKRDDYLRSRIGTKDTFEDVEKFSPRTMEILRNRHRDSVQNALNSGKAVQAEVLADYPGLQKQKQPADFNEVQQLAAIFQKSGELGRGHFLGEFESPVNIGGPKNAVLRQEIMSAIVGKKVSKSNANLGDFIKSVSKWITENYKKEETTRDQENITRIPGEERVGQEPEQAGPVEAAGEKEAPAGGVLQAPEEVDKHEWQTTFKPNDLGYMTREVKGLREDYFVAQQSPEHFDIIESERGSTRAMVKKKDGKWRFIPEVKAEKVGKAFIQFKPVKDLFDTPEAAILEFNKFKDTIDKPESVSQAEYLKYYGTAEGHRTAVQNALRAKTPVADAALKDYPDLAEASTPAGEEKEPETAAAENRIPETWEQTFDEIRKGDNWHMAYGGKTSYMGPLAKANMQRDIERIKKLHRADVEKAVVDGKPVPENVLAEYPELNKKQPSAEKQEAQARIKIIDAARKWQGAARKADALYGDDKKSRLAHSRATTKADLDAYLMKTFGIDETQARDVSNELTAKNYQPDATAEVADFKGEPWADTALAYKPETKATKAEKKEKTAPKTKLKSTDTALRRYWEMRSERVTEAASKPAAEQLAAIQKETNRADLFDVPLAEDATPGARRLLEYIRNNIKPFTEWAGELAGGSKRRRWSTKPGEALAEVFDGKTVHTTPEAIRARARAYIELLGSLRQELAGLKTVQEISEKYTTWRKDVKEETGPYGGRKVEAKESGGSVITVTFNGLLRHYTRFEPNSWTVENLIKRENVVEEKQKSLHDRPSHPLAELHREGLPDHRGGKDVTGEDLKKTFGFASVTYGKYNTQAVRQLHTNHFYDAMMDLAKRLGAKPTDMSLGGTLHIAIGALGHGKYSAHYSPNQPQSGGGTVAVINLTRDRGDGAVAHEWGHAIDYYLRTTPGGTAIMDKMDENLKTRYSRERVRKRVADFLFGGWHYKGYKNLARENALRWLRIGERGEPTQYFQNASKMDKGKGKNVYWTKPTEMFARAFEAAVYDTIEGSNPYLVNDFVEDGKTKPPAYKGTPYPMDNERTGITGLMSEFMDNLEWTAEGPRVKQGAAFTMDADRKAFYDEIEEISGNIDAFAKHWQEQQKSMAKPEETEPAPVEPNASNLFTGMDDDVLSALVDEQVSQEFPASEEETEDVINEGVEQAEKKTERRQRENKEPVKDEKTLGSVAREFKDAGIEGVDQALTGLYKLFGGGAVKSFPSGFDEAAYEAARPHFIAAYQATLRAGRSAAEFANLIVKAFGAKIKPFLMRFMTDVRDGVISLDKPLENDRLKQTEASHEAEGTDTAGEPESRPGLDEQSAVSSGILSGEGVGSLPEQETGGVPGRQDDLAGEPRGGDGKEHAEGPGQGEGARGGHAVERRTAGTGNAPARVGRPGEEDLGVGKGSALSPEQRNNVIADDEAIVPATKSQRIKANIDAIRLVKKLFDEDRDATPAEKKVLQQYTGWGALAQDAFNPDIVDAADVNDGEPYSFWDAKTVKKFQQWKTEIGNSLHPALGGILTKEEWEAAKGSTLNAHYTERGVIRSVWEAVRRLGFEGGRVLEPAGGVGHFFGLMPGDIAENSRLHGVELDSISSMIFRKLYPQANIQHVGFENARGIGHNNFDLVVSNFPFGDYPVFDKKHPEYSNWSIHNYFFARSLDAVKPGGIVAAITSRYTMDTLSAKTRDYLAERADLVGAIRLPNSAFQKNAGTEVVTDIIFLRKKSDTPVAGMPGFRYAEVVAPTETDARKWEKLKTKLAEAQEKLAASKGLKKREKEMLEAEVNAVREAISEVSAPVNEYFLAHPEMVLGTPSMKGTMYGTNQYTVDPREGADLNDLLAKAVAALPEKIMDYENTVHDEIEEEVEYDLSSREGSMVVRNGAVKIVEDGKLVDPEWIKQQGMRDKAERYVAVKMALGELVNLELSSGAADEAIKEARRELNRVYDALHAKYGFISTPENSKALSDDTEFPAVAALEDITKVSTEKKITSGKNKGQTRGIYEEVYSKGDIFRKRVNFPFEEPSKADTVVDAVQISLLYRNAINTAYVAELTGRTEGDVRAEILREGHAFINPRTGLLESKEEYLSGAVKEKLTQAEAAVEDNSEYEINVRELKKVIPKDIPIERISFRLGSEWIPEKIVQDFAADEVGITGTIKLQDSPQGKQWSIDVRYKDHVKNNTTWGGDGFTGLDLLTDSLNLKHPVIRKTDPDTKNTYTDQAATFQAQEKQRKMQEKFQDYVRKNEAPESYTRKTKSYATEVQEIYNARFNGTLAPEWREPKIEYFPGASREILLRAGQKTGVYRGVRESTIFAHGVGTGKTYLFISLAMEMKRLKTSRKAMIVVQNSTIDSYRQSIKKLYPTAKVLIPNEKQRDAQNRQKLFGQMRTGDYDIIAVPHSFFNMMPNDPAIESQYIQDELGRMEDYLKNLSKDEKQGFTAKQIEKAKKQKEAKLKELSSLRQDKSLYFEDLGIDALLIDEAHNYKRGDFFTKLDNVKGLDRASSARSFHLLLKTRHIQEKTGGKNVILATGTPISNTIAELWTMIRYTRPDLLERYGIENFDGFVSSFARTTVETEQTATGDFKQVERLNKYDNGPELLTFWRSAADVVLPEDADITGRPKIKGGAPQETVIPRSEGVSQAIADIKMALTEWQGLDGQTKRELSWVPIVLYGKARQIAIDPRLADSSAVDDPGSKLNTAIRNIHRIWRDSKDILGTQFVFSDFKQSADGKFNLAAEIREKLHKLGVPREEVAIIDDYKTDIAKERAFEDFRQGKKRVFIGSTSTLGTGTNIQDRAIAIHHIDVPLRPMDFEQRNGRGVRPGNMNTEIGIHVYGVKDTLDSATFQLLVFKQKFINQILRGEIADRSFDDPTDEVQMSFEDAMAAFSGMPELRQKFSLETEIRKLESLRMSHQDEQETAKHKVRYNRDELTKIANLTLPEAVKTDEKAVKVFPEMRVTAAEIEGKAVSEEIGKALNDLFHAYESKVMAGLKDEKRQNKDARQEFEIKINGVPADIRAYAEFVQTTAVEEATGKKQTAEEFSTVRFLWGMTALDRELKGHVNTGQGLLTSIISGVKNIHEKPTHIRQSVKMLEKDNATYQAVIDTPFQHEARLEEARKELREVIKTLEAKKDKDTAGKQIEGRATLDRILSGTMAKRAEKERIKKEQKTRRAAPKEGMPIADYKFMRLSKGEIDGLGVPDVDRYNWYVGKAYGRDFYGTRAFLLAGKPMAGFETIPHDGFENVFPKGEEKPVAAVAWNQPEKNKAFVYFSNSMVMDERYYRLARQIHPKATYAAVTNDSGIPVFVLKKDGETVGIIMPTKEPVITKTVEGMINAHNAAATETEGQPLYASKDTEKAIAILDRALMDGNVRLASAIFKLQEMGKYGTIPVVEARRLSELLRMRETDPLTGARVTTLPKAQVLEILGKEPASGTDDLTLRTRQGQPQAGHEPVGEISRLVADLNQARTLANRKAIHVEPSQTPSARRDGISDLLNKIFNHRVVWVKDHPDFDGTVYNNTIFLGDNLTKPQDVMRVFGHELFHAVRKQAKSSADLSAADQRFMTDLETAIPAEVFSEYREYRNRKNAQAGQRLQSDPELWEEYGGYILGDAMFDRRFYDRLSAESPSSFKRLVRWIFNALRKIGLIGEGNVISQYFAPDQAHRLITSAADYIKTYLQQDFAETVGRLNAEPAYAVKEGDGLHPEDEFDKIKTMTPKKGAGDIPTGKTPSKPEGGIEIKLRILKQDADSYSKDPEALVDELVDILGEDESTTVGARGIYKEEINEPILENSYQYESEDGDTREALPGQSKRGRRIDGTSAFKISGNWEFDDRTKLVKNIKENLDRAKYWGDTDYIAIIKGHNNPDEIHEDIGETVIRNPEVVAYIRKEKPSSDTPRSPQQGDQAAPSRSKTLSELESLEISSKPSNLNAFQRRQTQTPEFARWFGDSKVVDEHGEPLVVYHGTDEKFTAFEKSRIESESGFFFVTSKEAAKGYGDEVMAVYISSRKPFKTTVASWSAGSLPDVETLKKRGYDAIKIHDEYGDWQEPNSDVWMVFEPQQIKSATGNTGAFSPKSPDIRYSAKESRYRGGRAASAITETLTPFTAKADSGAFVSTMKVIGEQPRKFIREYRRAFEDHDLTKLERIFALPHHIAKWYTDFDRVMDVEETRQENHNELMGKLLGSTVKKNAGAMHEFLDLGQESKKKIERFLLQSDKENRVMRPAELEGLSAEEKSAYYAWKTAMDTALELRMQWLEKMNLLPYENREWFAALKDVVSKKGKKNREAAREKVVAGLTTYQKGAFGEAYRSVVYGRTEIGRLRRQIGRIKFYVPHQREGEYVVDVYDPSVAKPVDWSDTRPWKGRLVWSERSATKAGGTEALMRLRQKFPGMTVVDYVDRQTPEEVYQAVTEAAIEKFVENALQRAEGRGVSGETATTLRDALFDTVTDDLRARGWERHAIKRGKTWVGGYQTESLDKVFVDYMTGLSGSLTKMEAAYHYTEALKKIDPRKKELQDFSQNYVRNLTRNQQPIDRTVGKMKAMAFTWYITGKLSMVPIQLTQNFITGIPQLGRYVKNPARRYMQAMADVSTTVRREALPADEREALRIFHEKGLDQAKFMEDIIGQTDGYTKGVFKTVGRVLGMPFFAMENFNRKSAFLAAYRAFRKPGIREEYDAEAFKRARDFVNDTHFLMGRANKPELAAGATPGHAAVNLAYTFTSFTHNYVISLVDGFRTGGAREGGLVLLRSLAWLSVFGGLTALPFLDDLLDELEKLFGVPARANMRKALRAAGGRTLETLGMHGVPAVLGYDLSATMKTALPFKEGVSDTAFGVYGGLAEKLARGVRSFNRGDHWRAAEQWSPLFLENAMKGWRMANEVATSPSGRILYDDENQPLRLTGLEPLMQGMGIRPETVSASQAKRQERTNLVNYFSNMKQSVYDQYALANTAEKRQAAMRRVREFNREAAERAHGMVSPITVDSLRQSLIRRRRPDKKALQYERMIE